MTTFQDQAFANGVLKKVLEHCDFEEITILVKESDNCFSEFKFAEHFLVHP